MSQYELGITVIFILGVFFLCLFIVTNTEPITEEHLEEQRQRMKKKEAELNHIYWQISEIKRISEAKSIAIKSHNWDEYKRLCNEYDNLTIDLR